MLTGFVFQFNKEKNPYDFLTDEKTGKRPGENGPPNGFTTVDLRQGIEGLTLPPLAIWTTGMWGNEIPITMLEEFTTQPKAKEFEAWITTGEGTPSNFKWRIHILPEKLASVVTPKHPLTWPPEYKQKPSQSYQNWSGYTKYAPQPKKQTAATAPVSTLPVGIRFRCPGCGHWWKESTLAPHSTSCCPGLNGGESDWAIMCECCLTLDEVATIKPGFPRKPKVKDTTEKEPETAPAS